MIYAAYAVWNACTCVPILNMLDCKLDIFVFEGVRLLLIDSINVRVCLQNSHLKQLTGAICLPTINVNVEIFQLHAVGTTNRVKKICTNWYYYSGHIGPSIGLFSNIDKSRTISRFSTVSGTIYLFYYALYQIYRVCLL